MFHEFRTAGVFGYAGKQKHQAPRPAEAARRRNQMKPGNRSLIFGWWYVLIGAGFVLLGVNRLLVHDRPLLIGLRWLIAAGFFLLGWIELRRRSRG
jgi:Flp pilus assembly protein TadB